MDGSQIQAQTLQHPYHLSKSETEKQPTAKFAYGHLRVHFEATNLKKKKTEPLCCTQAGLARSSFL